MLLCYDILRLISLYLSPKHLSVNKELVNMYDDIWYYDKLQLLYSNLKLYKFTTWKDLYERYLQQGIIRYERIRRDEFYSIYNIGNLEYKNKLRTKGIKAVESDSSIQEPKYNYILTFNGDLYYETKTNVTIVDTQVIDINSRMYIKYINDKEYEVYISQEDSDVYWKKVHTFNQTLIKVSGWYILAENGIYYIAEYMNFFLPFLDCVDIYSLGECGIITNKKGEVYSFKFDYNNEFTNLSREYGIIFKPNIGIFNHLNEPINIYPSMNRDILINIVNYNEHIQKHDYYRGVQFIISNNNLLLFNAHKVIKTVPNIRNIFTTCFRIYLIE